MVSKLTGASNYATHVSALNSLIDQVDAIASFSTITADSGGPLTLGAGAVNQSLNIDGSININTVLDGNNLQIQLSTNVSGLTSLTATTITGTTISGATLGVTGEYSFPTSAPPAADNYVLVWNTSAFAWEEQASVAASSWTALSDTPNSFSGLGGRIPVINDAENAITTDTNLRFDLTNNILLIDSGSAEINSYDGYLTGGGDYNDNTISIPDSNSMDGGDYVVNIGRKGNTFTSNKLNAGMNVINSSYGNTSATTFSAGLNVACLPNDGVDEKDTDNNIGINIYVKNPHNEDAGDLSTDHPGFGHLIGLNCNVFNPRATPNANIFGFYNQVMAGKSIILPVPPLNTTVKPTMNSAVGIFNNVLAGFDSIISTFRGYHQTISWTPSITSVPGDVPQIDDAILFEIDFDSPGNGGLNLDNSLVMMRLNPPASDLTDIDAAGASEVLCIDSQFTALSNFNGPILINNTAQNVGDIHKNTEYSKAPLTLQVNSSDAQTTRPLIDFRCGAVAAPGAGIIGSILVEVNGTTVKVPYYANT